MQGESTPTSPSRIVEDFDPAVERVILHCLQKDPEKRPSSALAVAAGLPGGDPLAAAMAAGETPSPEMVAAAGEAGALSSTVAWSIFAAAIAGLALVALLSDKTMLYGRIRLEKPPEVLVDREIRGQTPF